MPLCNARKRSQMFGRNFAGLLMCEAVDNHDARVVGIGEAGRVNDAMRSWWDADLVCSATPAIVVGD